MPQATAATRDSIVQEEIFEVVSRLGDGPGWCHVVCVRCSVNELVPDSWTTWQPDFERPNHFRTREAAYARLRARVVSEKRKIIMGLMEFSVIPKWLGFTPAPDEPWIV